MSRLLAVALLALSACSSSTEATLEGFDTSCDVPEDCEAVLLGDVCACACSYGAINIAEGDAWAAQDADLRANCGDDILECGPCPDAIISCEEHVCQAAMAS